MECRTVICLAMAAVLVMIAPAILSGDVDAVDVADEYETYYCYGDHPTISFEEDPTGRTVDWYIVKISDNGTKDIENRENQLSIELDISDCKEVQVTQTVTDVNTNENVTETIVLVPLHLLDDGEKFQVTFMDGSKVFDTQEITNHTVVKAGDDHVFTPADPEKDGYKFSGWYDQTLTMAFNSKSIITGHTIFYAKWVSTGDETTNPPEQVGNHIVTFNVSPGLEYTVIGTDSGKIVFIVTEVSGFKVNGEISVTSNSGILEGSDLVYTLSDIVEDTVVTISADTSIVSGGSSSVNTGRGIVTFNVSPGLEYKVLSQSGNTVTFEINVSEGFKLIGDLSITSNRGNVVEFNGIYTLTGISGNVTVNVNGDTMYITDYNPNDPDVPTPERKGDFPLWAILAVLAAIIMVVAVVIYIRNR